MKRRLIAQGLLLCFGGEQFYEREFFRVPQCLGRRTLKIELVRTVREKAIVLAGDKAKVAPVKVSVVRDGRQGGGGGDHNNWRGQHIEMTESDLDEVAFLTGTYCFLIPL